MNSTADESLRAVHCKIHGDQREAYLCSHLLHGEAKGLYFDLDNPDDPYPDAWCSDCEKLRIESGGEWTDELCARIDVTLVCRACYREIKTRNEF
jgi:hypothetical protein